MADLVAKLELNNDESLLIERFIKTYQGATRGKMVLLKDTVCAGFILKESGILDLILGISSREDYINADSYNKTLIMTHCLREILCPTMVSAPTKLTNAEEPKNTVSDTLQVDPPAATEPPAEKPEIYANVKNNGLNNMSFGV